jgi:hypothetical protein
MFRGRFGTRLASLSLICSAAGAAPMMASAVAVGSPIEVSVSAEADVLRSPTWTAAVEVDTGREILGREVHAGVSVYRHRGQAEDWQHDQDYEEYTVTLPLVEPYTIYGESYGNPYDSRTRLRVKIDRACALIGDRC